MLTSLTDWLAIPVTQLLETDDVVSFATLGLHHDLLESLTLLGFTEPTPIQRYAIPLLLENHDLIGQAATGTGKTAAFALPILQHLTDAPATPATADAPAAAAEEANDTSNAERGKNPQALILVPTRELALQVASAVKSYGKALRARVAPIYGGESFPMQRKALRDGVDVVVATPGRALDHLKRGTLLLDNVKTMVLDEADEMLDMGFAEELNAIFDFAPEARQTVLFSATLPKKIEDLARRYLQTPKRIRIESSTSVVGTVPKVTQQAYVVQREHKARALARLLDSWGASSAIVFCRTRDQVDTLASTLGGLGHQAEAIHGGLSQEQRERVMARLRSEVATLMVATDVAARGLDIDHLTHIVNFDVPRSADTYVHRIGRVGRAGRSGVAVTLVEPREHRALLTIERITKQPIAVEVLPTAVEVEEGRTAALVARIAEAADIVDLSPDDSILSLLQESHDLEAIARGAIRLLSAGSKSLTDEADFPQLELGRRAAEGKGKGKGRAVRGRDDRGDRGGRGDWSERGDRSGRSDRGDRGDRTARRPKRNRFSERPDRREHDRDVRSSEERRTESRSRRGGMVRLYVGVGATEGVEPRDLMGAFTNEAGLANKEVGQIEIAPRFSLVEVPQDRVDEVIGSMREVSVRGRKLNTRREVDKRRDSRESREGRAGREGFRRNDRRGHGGGSRGYEERLSRGGRPGRSGRPRSAGRKGGRHGA